jgi:hypothetical protein
MPTGIYPVKHIHHIVPKHMGGDDSPDNLTPPISVELHAALHKDLYDHFGFSGDFFAWNTLLGQSNKGIVPYMTGKTHSNKTKAKISRSKRGQKYGQQTEAHRKHLSNANKGQVPWNKGKKIPHSDETKRKLSEANKGKTISEESRKKISESMKRYHAGRLC